MQPNNNLNKKNLSSRSHDSVGVSILEPLHSYLSRRNVIKTVPSSFFPFFNRHRYN